MKNILRLLISALLIALVLGLLIVLMGLIFQWKTTTQFSNGFFWAAVILIIAGILSVAGLKTGGSFGVVYSQSAGDMNIVERGKRWVDDITRGYNTFLLLLIIGLILAAIAVLIPNVF